MILICEFDYGDRCDGGVTDISAFEIGRVNSATASKRIQRAVNDYVADNGEFDATDAAGYIAASTGFEHIDNIGLATIRVPEAKEPKDCEICDYIGQCAGQKADGSCGRIEGGLTLNKEE